MNISNILQASADRFGQKPALIFKDQAVEFLFSLGRDAIDIFFRPAALAAGLFFNEPIFFHFLQRVINGFDPDPRVGGDVIFDLALDLVTMLGAGGQKAEE